MVDPRERSELIRRRLPESASAEIKGSALDPALLDGWSDLDLDVWLAEGLDLAALLAPSTIWSFEAVDTAEGQVVRVVLVDGGRVDFTVARPGRFALPLEPEANDVRFVAAMAATKLGRGDQLIGLHLCLDLVRRCLVAGMLLRDRDRGTSIHRTGNDRDRLAAELISLFHPSDGVIGPEVVLAVVERYDRVRADLNPGYRSDWSGLVALIDRGRG